MKDPASAVRWLGGLDESSLAALLRRRPDVLAGVPPRDLADLAHRLQHPASLVAVLRSVPLSYLQLVEAAQALGSRASRTTVAQLLDGSGPGHRAAVGAVIDDLAACAVLLAGEDGALSLPDSMNQLMPSPLELGPPLIALLRAVPVDGMRKIQVKLGLERRGNRADTEAAVAAHLAEADTVRAIVATAGPSIQSYLLGEARPSELGAAGTRVEFGYDADDEDEDDEDDYQAVYYDPRHYRDQQLAIQWASERGLMYAAQYSYSWLMPAEIGLALRGPDYRAPFSPDRPVTLTQSIDRTRSEADSAAAATAFAGHALALLDHLARVPVASVKAGGIGTRELGKLAKLTASQETATRLALELARAAGLLVHTAGTVTVSDGFARWREADPADRFVTLLQAWWEMAATPTQARDPDGKPLRALAGDGQCASCRVARTVVVEILAELDGATNAASLAAAALWQRPMVHIVDDDVPFATQLREAELLGVLSQGGLSALGRALLSGDLGTLRARAAEQLPKSSDSAVFGADLTVYVAGAPSRRVSALLDSAADREGRGGAVTWRFSQASVRRAMDDGISGETLTEQLAAIASTQLPQPLRYLLADVARRHGNLRLSSAASCVRSDDTALLAEVAADRRLTKLGLRVLAPTVLVSDVAQHELLLALRKFGYLPMSEDVPDNVVSLSGQAHASVPAPSATTVRRASGRVAAQAEPLDPRAVAASLLHSHAQGQSVTATATERQLASLTRSLTVPEIRQLAHAIDQQSRVCITYESASGGRTERVIDPAELSGGTVYAWCELRQDERMFTVSRIRSVTAI